MSIFHTPYRLACQCKRISRRRYEDVLSLSWLKSQSLVQVTRKKTTKLSIKVGVSVTISVSGCAEKTKTEDTEDTAAAAV